MERRFFEMNISGKAAMRAGVVFLAVFLGFASPAARAAVTVPFVGCVMSADNPILAPVGKPVTLHIPPQIAAKLAVYAAGDFFRVLAPRGWVCSGTIAGIGGDLSLSIYPPGRGENTSGPIARIVVLLGDTGNGNALIASIGGSYFPDIFPRDSLRTWVMDNPNETIDQFMATISSDDSLIYLSKTELRFMTPAGKQGLGDWVLRPSKKLDSYGLLKLVKDSDGVFNIRDFGFRLPPNDAALRPYILDFMK